MDKNLEKRKRERVDYVLDAKFTLSGGKTITCKLHDISMSGFFLQTEEVLSVGSKGTIHITLQFGENIRKVEALCTVTRSLKRLDASGFALQISKIDTDSSINLYNMIKFQTH